ncbi:uncharacterized protein E0L32_008439 [Thyridium curvatum]|uniref:Uncharacterized protein n=1 Tax=Thyridium curvatum TaxID=1093900 RepID=A0A507ARW7_9PEZI|nr:uncharacterized protein E0L32_008439 [Thyridium curvatum]TPX10553.1 hypothetical protein E0L32_008439 [Thyridium curvatum]
MASATDTRRSNTPERLGRSSFSSIRERDDDLAQTFTSSKISSYNTPLEHAIDDSSADEDTMLATQTQFAPPITQPSSRLHGYWAPPDSFKGWKGINVKGKLASKSFGDLQILNNAWKPAPSPPRVRGRAAPGEAIIEVLPIEILNNIIGFLELDIPPNGIERRNVDLMSCLLTSKTMHTATLNTLYTKVTIPHSRIFHKFLVNITAYPALGTIVRRLDFSHFNPSSLFSTARERLQTRNLTPDTLLQCLQLTPCLQEFMAQEYIDDELDINVLRKLFTGLDRIRALDFCGCSSTAFKSSFLELTSAPLPETLMIERLSLHKCLTLPSSVLDAVLPRLKFLTHLDVAGTRLSNKALQSIPHTAKLTHLNLAKCNALSADNVIDFIQNHPAAKQLVFLSLASDARSHELLSASDVTTLIPLLPKTLKSLSLKGSKMNASHIDLLLPLTKHLEELALGRSLKLQDVDRLFIPDESKPVEEQVEWVPHTIKYLDLTDMWGNELDLTILYNVSCLLKRYTEPLEVIELADDAFKRLRKSPGAIGRAGWRISDLHVRSWLVRNHDPNEPMRDDGRRPWKMGAQYWGMRKVPVTVAEVGGMYGSFMFGRQL